MSTKPRVGLKDIAACTGVSSAAVSLVLNNRPGVSPETRRRVNDAAKRLGYKPRGVRARPLAGVAPASLRTIGFYAFGVNAALGHSYYGAILSGASAAARDSGLQLSFEAFEAPISEPEELPSRAADGLLITGRPPREFVERLDAEGVPYVLVCCSLAHLPGDTIGPENIDSSYRAVHYLAELGHERIAYLGGEASNPDARERYLGYRWAVEDLGLGYDDRLVLLSFFDTEHGVSGFEELRSRDVPFTALYAASDFLAIGAYASAREAGLSVPDGLSVIGFDNNTMGASVHPKLTTIGLDRERVGRLAVTRLCELVGLEQPPLVQRVPAELIVRDSCASPRGHD